jgi:hypothetical protein
MQNKKEEELHVLMRKVYFNLRSEFDQTLCNQNQRRQIIVAMFVDDF